MVLLQILGMWRTNLELWTSTWLRLIRDPYAMLGVSRDASPEAIRKAYKALMRSNHPVRVGNTLETSNNMR